MIKKKINLKNNIRLIIRIFNSIILEALIKFFKLFRSPKIFLICDVDIAKKLLYKFNYLNKSIYSFHKYSFSDFIYRKNLKNSRKKNKTNFIDKKINYSNFENKVSLIVEHLLEQYIPTSLFKGLDLSINRSKYIFPNSAPENIITSSNILKDEIFNIFILRSLDCNSKYTILQHGGGYGFSKINDEEEYQLNTADNFLTWGWGYGIRNRNIKRNNANIIKKYGCIMYKKNFCKQLRVSNIRKGKSRKIFIALNEWEKVEFRLYSFPTSDGLLDKYINITKLIKYLQKPCQHEIVLRGYLDGPFNLKMFIEKELKVVNYIDRTKSNLYQNLIDDYYLFITDSNSTAWLESLSLNIPSILLIGNEFKDINERVLPIFQSCIDNFLIFEKPKEASIWINDNFSNIDKWWFSNKTQNCRKKILNFYFKENIGLEELLKNLSQKSFTVNKII